MLLYENLKKVKNDKAEVFDIETLSNCFTYTGYNIQEDKWYQYVIHQLRNDYDVFIEHLQSGLYFIGFNSESFDYPIIHHLINHYDEYRFLSATELATRIYSKSQQVISSEFTAIADKNKWIPNLDLFKLNHYDNPGRMANLKTLEVSMRLPNVEDMPIHHSHWITTLEEIDQILSYNKNDVYATYQLFLITKGDTDNILYKGKDKIALRKSIQQKFKLPCLNLPDVVIGERLLLKLYCEATNLPINYVKDLRTFRKSIDINECIFPYIKFETEPFQLLLKWFKSQTITSTNGAFSNIPTSTLGDLKKYTYPSLIKIIKDKNNRKVEVIESLNLRLQDTYVAYGTGGLHGSISGLFKEDEEYCILDIDVGLI